MLDSYGRNIEYMRLSITDRCNLRCRYCMPNGIQCTSHGEILSYEEILRLCRIAVSLGIDRFKVTGGEPLVRPNCTDFVKALKATEGVRQVTITTNGLLLPENLEGLIDAGIDCVTFSLDSLRDDRFNRITGHKGPAVEGLLDSLEACCRAGIRTKVNTVLLEENLEEIPALARLAETRPIDVRFIELMPIGFGAEMKRVSPDTAFSLLRQLWPDLHPTNEKRGNGPARHYESRSLLGKIGFIDAVSHKFCSGCNRVRLTSTGRFKPCLCYDAGADLRALLRGGSTDDAVRETMGRWIGRKPAGHCFDTLESITERKTMSQIGG